MDWGDRIGRRLKPRDLHIFMAVAEEGNMAKAAERLAISRPVVSKTIADLERTLGVPLFDRSPQGIEQTLYGRALSKRSVAIFDELRQSVREIEYLADPSTGEVRIGCTETIAAGLAATAIEALSRRHPQLHFRTELGDVTTLRQYFLRERKCELIISRLLPPIEEPDLETEPLFYEKHILVVGPGSKWLRRRKIALADLINEPWILSPAEIVPGAPFFEALRASRLTVPVPTILSTSLTLRSKLLPGGPFITIAPDSVLRFGSGRLPFEPLQIKLPRTPHPVAITTLKNRTLSPTAQLFIKALREFSKPLSNRK